MQDSFYFSLNPAHVCADHPTSMEQTTHTGEGGLFFLKLNPAHVCTHHPTPTEQANHMGEGLVQPHFEKVKGGFLSTSGIKKNIF